MLFIEGSYLGEWILERRSKDSSVFHGVESKLLSLIINLFGKVYLIEQKFFRQHFSMIAGFH